MLVEFGALIFGVGFRQVFLGSLARGTWSMLRKVFQRNLLHSCTASPSTSPHTRRVFRLPYKHGGREVCRDYWYGGYGEDVCEKDQRCRLEVSFGVDDS